MSTMKKLIILDLGTQRNIENDNTIKYRYDEIIDAMIKGKKIRYQYPDANVDVYLRINSNALSENSAIRRILLSVFDNVVETDSFNRKLIRKLKNSGKYNKIHRIKSELVGTHDAIIDNDYEYHQIKQQLGPMAQ